MNQFEEQQSHPSDVFKFGIDETSRAYMLETARWAKFLAIVGFISVGLIILAGFFMGVFLSGMSNVYGNSPLGALSGAAFGSIYLVLAALYVYPIYALYKFAVNVKPAIQLNDQGRFNEALRFLKGMFKYVGILTIIILAIYGLVFIFALIGVAVAGIS